MLSKPVKNIMVRVIKNRMANGEGLEEILAGYTKLSEEEKEELRQAVKEGGK
jgi:hypothetical protein